MAQADMFLKRESKRAGAVRGEATRDRYQVNDLLHPVMAVGKEHRPPAPEPLLGRKLEYIGHLGFEVRIACTDNTLTKVRGGRKILKVQLADFPFEPQPQLGAGPYRPAGKEPWLEISERLLLPGIATQGNCRALVSAR